MDRFPISKTIVSWLVTLAAAIGTGLYIQAPAAALHSLKFDKTDVSLGKIYDNETLVEEFRFTTGEDEVTILSINHGCACTSVGLTVNGRQFAMNGKGKNGLFEPVHDSQEPRLQSSVVVPAFSSGIVRIKAALGGRSGSFSATASLLFECRELETVNLKAECEIVPIYTVTPREIVADNVNWRDITPFSVTINVDAHKSNRTLLTCRNPPIGITYDSPLRELSKGQWVITGKINVSLLESPSLVIFSSDNGAMIKVPVITNITNTLNVTPGKLVSLGRFAAKDGASCLIKIQWAASQNIRITGHSISGGNLSKHVLCTITENADKQGASIVFRARPDIPRGVVRSTLTITTSHPYFESVEIEVVGYAR